MEFGTTTSVEFGTTTSVVCHQELIVVHTSKHRVSVNSHVKILSRLSARLATSQTTKLPWSLRRKVPVYGALL